MTEVIRSLAAAGALAISASACGGDAGTLADGTRVRWMTALGGPGEERLERLTADASGRSLVAVLHEDGFVVGDDVFAAPEVPSLAWASLDADGDAPEGWSLQPPPAEIYAGDLARDALGNLYLGGFLTGGALDVRDVRLEPTGGTGFDGYLVKFGPSGELRWAERYGGSASVELKFVRLLDNGQLWVGGDFRGRFEIGGAELSATDAFDVFAVRLSPTGIALDVVTLEGPGATRSSALSPTPDGGLVIGGVFEASLSVRGASGDVGLAADGTGGFVVRLDPDGEGRWLRTWSAADGSRSVSALAAEGGRVAAGGTFSGRLATETGATVGAVGRSDGWIRIFDDDGQLLEASVIAGGGADGVTSLILDPRGALWAAGRFDADLALGVFDLSVEPGAITGWVARFDDALVPTLAFPLGRGDASELAVAPGGDILVGAEFEEALQVGDLSVEAAGGTDVVVLRIAGD